MPQPGQGPKPNILKRQKEYREDPSRKNNSTKAEAHITDGIYLFTGIKITDPPS
jgi:hypothetical protein